MNPKGDKVHGPLETPVIHIQYVYVCIYIYIYIRYIYIYIYSVYIYIQCAGSRPLFSNHCRYLSAKFPSNVFGCSH